MSRLTNAFKFTSARRRIAALTASASAALLASPFAQAALPTVTAAGGGAGATDYLGQMSGYSGQAIGLGLLLLTSFAFIVVAANAIGKYSEYTKGKATLGDLKGTVLVGAVLLMIVMFLAAQSAGIIGTTDTFINAQAGAPAA